MPQSTLTYKGKSIKILDMTEHLVYYVIEHQTRGLFAKFDHSPTTNEWGPRFRNGGSITRGSPEIWNSTSLGDAFEMIARVQEHIPTAYLVKMLRRTPR